ncbi:MAG: hypothetical protein JW917_09655 [Ignavibacteria bacterium]|nr:hypothetical protein [Ignavibacteria bacterium]
MKQIPGFPLYYAGEDGRIYKQKGKYVKQLTQFIAPYGKYLFVYLTTGKYEKKSFPVHKLIASAYYETDCKDIEVEHMDGNLLNNKPENLMIKKSCKPDKLKDEPRIKVINFYERILKRKINFDLENELWQRYCRIKESGNSRKIYNWLYANLR